MSRYLWAVGKNAEAFRPGDSLTDRYLYQGQRIFLDTQPLVPPENLDEVPEEFLPYLRLSPYQIHIPQVYDWVMPHSGHASPILLLDQAPLYTVESLSDRGLHLQGQERNQPAVHLFPSLEEAWKVETPLRQLHWLWQMANLWYPMNTEHVASSLFYPELLRVEGPILRLLELRFDTSGDASLSALGQSWLNLAQLAHPSVQGTIQQICQQLTQGQIRTAEMLVAALDQSLAQVGTTQQTRTLHINTLSDKGPSRQRNEDACYPDSGTIVSAPPEVPLAIVCDGIGGHQGGDVASNLAIQTIKDHLLSLRPDHLSPDELWVKLENTVCAANTVISQQNDAEQRFDRQRMGTTVVMGLARNHELYITHVGDSRAYWITRWGCHQVTQDDDVASREVRLGYSTYSQALQQPSAGSLVQALGMSATNLYPTVQRFILDEDSVFLLCSDGLSDNDRIEEKWEEIILPLLTQGKDLATVGRELVEIANSLNGYDNTTIALIHCQISGEKSSATLQPSSTVIPSSTAIQSPPRSQTQPYDTAIFAPESPSRGSTTAPTARIDSGLSNTPTKIPEPSDYVPQRRRSGNGMLLLGIIGLAGVLATLLALMFGGRWFGPNNREMITQSGPNESATDLDSPQPDQTPPTPIPLEQDDVIRVSEDLMNVRTARPNGNLEPVARPAFIPAGSLVYVIDKGLPDQIGDRNIWLELAVCDSGNGELDGTSGQPIDTLPPNSPFANPDPNTPSNNAPSGQSSQPSNKPINRTDLKLISASMESEGAENRSAAEPIPLLERGQRAWIRESDLSATNFIRSEVETDRTTCRTAVEASEPAPSPQEPGLPFEQPEDTQTDIIEPSGP
jgi:serine/threonine protein phosphatase PrpC